MTTDKCTLIKEGEGTCDTYLWKEGVQIETDLPIISEIGIAEIHVKPDGAVDDKPSLLFLMQTGAGLYVVTQISFDTIWPAIEAAIRSRKDLV